MILTAPEGWRFLCDDGVQGPGNDAMEGVGVHRLDQVVDETGLKRSADIAFHAETADGDSGHIADLAEFRQELSAVAIGQADVADDQVELVAGGASRAEAAVSTAMTW